MPRFDDPPNMPKTGESPLARLAQTVPLVGTLGQTYVERRGVPVEVAAAAGVCFDSDFGGRAAVIVPLHDRDGALTSVHGRYLHNVRGQNKMLTIGPGGGTIYVLGGWRVDPLIFVEGLFDALSLATCGWPAVATIGRWAPWLPEVAVGRVVWLAFDATRQAEVDVARYAVRLPTADVRRLLPPPRCKDWNTALVKRGQTVVSHWVRDRVAARDGSSTASTDMNLGLAPRTSGTTALAASQFDQPVATP